MKRIKFDDDGCAMPVAKEARTDQSFAMRGFGSRKSTVLPADGQPMHLRTSNKETVPIATQPSGPDRPDSGYTERKNSFSISSNRDSNRDFTDHFETPLVAVQHIVPVLDALCSCLDRDPRSLRIYDPFYCTGAIHTHFKACGYSKIIHADRDFYNDISTDRVPSYDVLVTNPPFSGDHKERILQYCASSKKPWMVLMPNYVATKQYYGPPTKQLAQEPFFVVPGEKYEFTHPDGKFRESSPFFSIWYVHGGDKHVEVLGRVQRDGKRLEDAGASVCAGVQQLKGVGAVRDGNRPSAKQRKRMKKRIAASQQD